MSPLCRYCPQYIPIYVARKLSRKHTLRTPDKAESVSAVRNVTSYSGVQQPGQNGAEHNRNTT